MNKQFKKAMRFAGDAVNLAKDVATKGPAMAALDKVVSLAGKADRDRKKRGLKAKNTAVVDTAKMVQRAAHALVKQPRATGEESFKASLIDPFSIDARGARVPDLYSFPTATYRLQTSMLVGTGLSSFGLTLLPSPYLTVIDNSLTSGLAACVTGPGGMRPFSGALGYYAFTTPAQMTSIAQNFRVVGGGIKIRNLIPELTATGRVYVAVLPVADGGLPNYQACENAVFTTTSYQSVARNMGIPFASQLLSPSLQMYPMSHDYTVGQMVGAHEVDVNFSIFHPNFFKFKPANIASSNFDGVLREADDVFWTSATGVVNTATSGNKEGMQSDGGGAIVIFCDGFPVTTSAPIEIDVCLHLETTPAVTANSITGNQGIVPESDNPPRSAVGSSAMVEHEICAARINPNDVIRLVQNDKGSGGARIARS